VTRIPRTALLALPVALALGCTSGGPRPVPELPRPGADTLERLRVDETNRETSAVALIALPREDLGPGDPKADDPAAPVPGAQGGRPDDLGFEELLRSVEERFPLILAALEELEVAEGELLSAEGGFDLRLRADGAAGIQGFYENDAARVTLLQPTTAWGATIFGGYKYGGGDFPVWEGGRRTNEDGEFRAGVRLPLLAGRAIDARRLALWRARVTRAQADPLVLQKRLEATRKAASAYWKWVSAGQKREIARRLLALAEDRQEGFELSYQEGELARVVVAENRRFVVERETILIRAERELQQAAIALSLFWRDADGAPMIPDDARLPLELPKPTDPGLLTRDDDTDLALRRRPEVRAFELERERIALEIRKAENDLLPRLDVAVAGSQDVGDAVSDPDDKGPFEFDAFLTFDVPVQRRGAKGRVRTLGAEGVQVERKLQLARDQVVAEVRDARSALQQTWQSLAQARENVQLAGEIEQVERFRLEEGDSDLLTLNIREQQTAAAAATLVDVVSEHFQALADYRASLGVPYDEVLR
jgi:outer membrane protein TolC